MKKKLTKALVLSLATTLTVGMTTVSTFAADKNISNTLSSVSIPSISGYSIENSGLNSKAIAALKEKAAELQNSGVYADATKSTYIKFNGSPVQKVTYDGKPHGLSAGVYATIGNDKVAEADMFYVGALANGTYYASTEAPTEEGYYYVAATYPGSNEYYPIIAYGIIVIKPAPTPDPTPVDPDKPDPGEDPDKPNPGEDPDKPNPGEDPDKPNPGEDPDKPDDGKKDDGKKDDNKKDDDNKGAVVDNNNNNTNNTNTPTIKKVSNKTDNTKKAPKTADTASYTLYLATLLVAGAVTVVTFMMRKRRK